MTLAKVLTHVVGTEKNKSLHGKKIFVVQPLDEKLQAMTGSAGIAFLALDHVQAGVGDTVIICREGNGCRQLLSDDGAPVNAVITGIVDAVEPD